MCDNKIIEPNMKLIYRFIESTLLIIYPICPHWAQDIWLFAESMGIQFKQEWYTVNEAVDNKLVYYADCIENTVSQCITKSKNKSITITVYPKFNEQENIIIALYKTFDKSKQTWNEFVSNTIKSADKKNMGNYGKFLKYIATQVDKYSSAWLTVVDNDLTEYELYNTWINKLVYNKLVNNNIIIEIGKNKTDFKNGPGNPLII